MRHPDLKITYAPALHPDYPNFTDINSPHLELDGPALITTSPYVPEANLLPSMELKLLTLSLTILQPKSRTSYWATACSGSVRIQMLRHWPIHILLLILLN